MRTSTWRALSTLGAALLALGMAACGDRLPNTPGPGPGLALQFNLGADILGGSSDAYARVDRAHLVVSQGSAALLDTLASFSTSGDGRLSLQLRLPNPTGTVIVTVELLGSGRILFRGSGSAEARRGTTVTIPLAITPVVSALAAPDSIVMTAVGDTVRLRAVAVFASGDTIPNALATWAGDGGSVVRVGADGLVTALREGQATATASYQGFTRSTRVRVQAVVTRITLSADTFSLQVDSTRTLGAVARDRNGNVLQRTFTWRSSNSAVASVDASGVVKGIALGSAIITASSESQSASATVTVRRTPVAAVKVTPAGASLLPGDTARLTATTLDSAGLVLAGRVVTWASDNITVATVDASGLVRGVAPGSAGIAATSEGKSGSAAIQVVQPLVAVSATSAGITVYSGGAPASKSVAVTNGGTGTLSGLSASVAYAPGLPYTGWLNASLGSTTAPTTLTLTASPGALGVGTYNATVTVSSSLRGAGSAAIAVQMIVQNPLPQLPVIALSPAAITLHMQWDTATVNISNAGAGSLTGLSAAVTSQSPSCQQLGTSWLSVSVSPTTAPAHLHLNAIGMLSPGMSCTASVRVSSTVPGVAPATLSVTYQ